MKNAISKKRPYDLFKEIDMNKQIEVIICSGTACYVMGGSELLLLEENLPESWRDRVTISGSPCLGFCRDRQHGKAPFVSVNGTTVPRATIPVILELIGELLEAHDAPQ